MGFVSTIDKVEKGKVSLYYGEIFWEGEEDEVFYLKKAYSLHNWFSHKLNIRKEDEQRLLHKEQLEGLYDVLKKVNRFTEDNSLYLEEIKIPEVFSEEQMSYMEQHFPDLDSTDEKYGYIYFYHIRKTLAQVKKILKEWDDNYTYIYYGG